MQWHQYHHHHPITVCQIVVGQSPNVLTKISSHDWSIIMTLWCSAMASLSSSSSSNHYLPNSSWAIPKCIHDRSNVLSEIFSPLFLIRGGGGDEKSLEKWESGTGVRTKLKILAWVPLVIVFFLHWKNNWKTTQHNLYFILDNKIHLSAQCIMTR